MFAQTPEQDRGGLGPFSGPAGHGLSPDCEAWSNESYLIASRSARESARMLCLHNTAPGFRSALRAAACLSAWWGFMPSSSFATRPGDDAPPNVNAATVA